MNPTNNFKVKVEEQFLVHSFKKKPPKEIPFQTIPLELISRIFYSLNLGELTALSLTSKTWIFITANMPLWKRLCEQAALKPTDTESARDCFFKALANNHGLAFLASAKYACESKNIHIESNIKRTLNELFIAKETLPFKEHQTEITNLIRYLNLVKTTENGMNLATFYKTDWEIFVATYSNVTPAIRTITFTYFLILLLEDRLNDIPNKNDFCKKLIKLVKESAKDPTVPDWINPKPHYSFAFSRILKYTNSLSDAQSFQFFQDLIKYGSWPKTICEQAEFHMAKMRFEQRTQKINDHQAIAIFTHMSNNSQNSQIPKNIQETSKYYLANMRIYKRNFSISKLEAFQLFEGVSKNSEVSQDIREAANYYMTKYDKSKKHHPENLYTTILNL